MTWRIPPVGWCVTCLAAWGEEVPALVIFKGTGLCRKHLKHVLDEVDGVTSSSDDEDPE